MLMQVEVKDGKAVGNVSSNGQDRPIKVDLPGPLLADGAGSPQVLGTLPLAAGYKTTFDNFDIMRQRVKKMQLEVVREESVTVPAGTFTAWVVAVSPADGANEKMTFWIDTKTRKYVKSSAVMAQMGGAQMVSELQE
eukprot:TRINITY_DN49933_c0_g1_i5.p1 TRINITY_DN49933_c0_g1~~TRINITY_DN49933_c0_g1_i5.p1  ORF type:complete len:137 (-),score=23.60 TRINITY_DN49933_c0_g1_i5:89-499(-)